MPITTDDLLSLAEELAHDLSGSEAHIRASISRAYYAAFLRSDKLDALVCDKPEPRDGKGVHARRISKFSNIPLDENRSGLSRDHALLVRTIAYLLKDLKAKRTLADYGIEKDCHLEAAKQSIAMAKRVNATISELYLQLDLAA